MDIKTDTFQHWMISFISRKHNISDLDEDYLLNCNLFEKGLIDSFGIMNLVMELESEFNITFTPDDFQDRRFSSITGLKSILSEKTNNQ